MKNSTDKIIEHLYGEDTESIFLQKLLQGEGSDWYLNELKTGGPDHKRILSALLVTRIDKLVKKVEKKSKQKFTAADGMSFEKKYTTGKEQFPVAIVATGNMDTDNQIATALEDAPDHELVAYLTAMQALTWIEKQI